jgi:hypothetical protein
VNDGDLPQQNAFTRAGLVAGYVETQGPGRQTQLQPRGRKPGGYHFIFPLVEQIVGNEPDAPTWNYADIWHAEWDKKE